MKDIPLIKLLKVDNNYYVYDANKNSIIKITEKAYLEIKTIFNIGINNYLKKPVLSDEDKNIIQLYNKGYLHKSQIDEINNELTSLVNPLTNRCLNNISLQITQNCNFRCRYCSYANGIGYNRHHQSKAMKEDVAFDIINFLFEHNKDTNNINIGLYGGEPFLEFELIKKIVEHARKKFQIKNLFFSVTTNLSILNEHIANFISENEFRILVSLDGPSDIQNKQRKFAHNGFPTHEIVEKNLLYLKDNYPDYFEKYVRINSVVVETENVPYIIEYFDKLDISIDKIDISYVDLEDIELIIADELEKSDDFKSIKLSNYEKKNESEISMFFQKSIKKKGSLPKIFHHGGPCLTGCSRLFVDADGNFLPCEKVMESRNVMVGDIYNGYNLNKIKEYINIGKLTEDECKNCWAIRLCKVCVARCVDEDGNLSKNSKLESCKIEKEIIEYFMKKYIKNKEGII